PHPARPSSVIRLFQQPARVAQTLTDSAGNFILRAPAPGKYWIRAQRLGYVAAASSTIETDSAEQVADITITMRVQGIRMDTLVVDAKSKGLQPGRNQFVRRCAGAGSICLTEQQIRASGARRPSDVFETIPGLAVVDSSGNARSRTVRSFVGWGCFVIFLNNNVAPMQRVGAGPILDIKLDELVLADIVGIEVYRLYREVPRELRDSILAPDIWPSRRMSSGGCGIAMVWTKSAW
ncbi:MAG: carboxypeptidase regulatory-like domain-containing protein, partial [Gemmatimonadota bacterium]